MSKEQLAVEMVSKQDLFSWTTAFQNKEFLARDDVHLTGNVGEELLTWPKSLKMKFVEVKNVQIKLRNRLLLRITVTQREASWCIYSVVFGRKWEGRRSRGSGLGCLYSRAGQPLPHSPRFALCQLLAKEMLVCFGCGPRLFGLLIQFHRGEMQGICLTHLLLEPQACCAHHHCQASKCLCPPGLLCCLWDRSKGPHGELRASA